jgi:hypothetical protein
MFGQTATWKPSSNPTAASLASPSHLFTLGAELNDLFPGEKSDFPNDIVPTPSRKTIIPESSSKRLNPPSSFDSNMRNWLLSLGLTKHQDCCFEGPTLFPLSNGVLLCNLIETLERTKLSGVCSSPKTTANRRGNLRRSLEFLRKKPSFPPELHYIEEKLLAGEGKSWRKVLLELQRIYRYAGIRVKRG